MALINQPFPNTGSKIAEPDGTITLAYRYLLQALWARTGSAPGVDITNVENTANAALTASAAAQTTANAAQSSANTAQAAAGTAQNTANSALTGANASLKIANDLSDLNSASTARNNLGLGPIATSATATGWAAPTGTLSRASVDGNWTQTISAIPTQAEVQAVVAQLSFITQTLAALITDETTVKTIGP